MPSRSSGTTRPRSSASCAWDALQELKASGEHVTESGVRIDKGQFGKKIGKHAEDYGLDPSSERARALMMRDIRSIVDKPDEVVDNVRWGRGDDKARYSAFCQGDDAVLVRNGDASVTILRGGARENARIENSRNSLR